MSDSSVQLRRTIASAGDLRAVVRTMKALAASSIGQYEDSVRALEGYYRTVELGLGACLRAPGATGEARAEPVRRAAPTVLAVVFGSDQGLVGQFNETIADFSARTLSALAAPARVWAVGERVQVRLLEAGLAVAGRLAVPSAVHGITPLVGQVLLHCGALESPDASTELHLFHNRPAVGSVYRPARQRLLPLDAHWRHNLSSLAWPTKRLPEVAGRHGPTLRALIREYLFVSLYRACAESLASENASRLAAMERADRNIGELLGDLQGRFNRLRQSSIDAELFDVIAGFEALDTAGSGGVRDQNRS